MSKEQKQANKTTAPKQQSPNIDTPNRQDPLIYIIQRAMADPATLSFRDAQRLQRLLGNQTVRHMLSRSGQRQPIQKQASAGPAITRLPAGQGRAGLQLIQAKLVQLQDGFYALDEDEDSIVNDGDVKYKLITHDNNGAFLLEDNWGDRIWYDTKENKRVAEPGPMVKGGVGFAPIPSFRVQGGEGHKSVGIIKYGEDRPIDPAEMEKQLNLAVGDILHSRYFAHVKRGGNGTIVKLSIDRYFFFEWIVKASIEQRRANSNDARLFVPPDDVLIPFIEQEIEKFLREHKGNQDIDVGGVLGNWAEGLSARKGIKPIPAPRIGDYKQPSYKVEMEPPWPFLLSLFSSVQEAPRSAKEFDAPVYDPEEVKNPDLLRDQITKLLAIAQETRSKQPKKPGKKASKSSQQAFKEANEEYKYHNSRIRRLESLLEELELSKLIPPQDQDKYDSGLFKIYNEFGRLKREILPPEQWFSLII